MAGFYSVMLAQGDPGVHLACLVQLEVNASNHFQGA